MRYIVSNKDGVFTVQLMADDKTSLHYKDFDDERKAMSECSKLNAMLDGSYDPNADGGMTATEVEQLKQDIYQGIMEDLTKFIDPMSKYRLQACINISVESLCKILKRWIVGGDSK